jgi:hypothetical protein
LICLSDGFADFASQKLYDLIVCFVNLVFLAKKSCLFVCVPVRRNLVCFCVSLCEEILCACVCFYWSLWGVFSKQQAAAAALEDCRRRWVDVYLDASQLSLSDHIVIPF